MPNDDNYGMDSDEAAPSMAQDHDESKPHEDKDEGETSSALLPKTLMAGKDFKPGDEIVLKIDHIYEDEFEVSYASEKSDKPKKPMSTMDEADGAMDKMAMNNSGNPSY